MHDSLREHQGALIDELSGWVRLRSVAGEPGRVPDLARSANCLAARLGEIGFPTVGAERSRGEPARTGQSRYVPSATAASRGRSQGAISRCTPDGV